MKLGHFDPKKHGEEGAKMKNMVKAWLEQADKESSTLYLPVTRTEMLQILTWVMLMEQKLEKRGMW